ncbi:MAG: Rossmann-fold NAD(P)-binding domain-containing protein [Minisyncoccota bacterium]
MKSLKIGFIGQGWIGKNYANDFEKRGFNVIRYSQEEPYIENKNKIKECEIVFIAVPTPTTPTGFDLGVVKKVIKLVGKGNIAVLKSTIFPGSTEDLQKENPDIYVMHSPEFLTEATAAFDASHPDRNIVGIPKNSNNFIKRAKLVLSILPKSPYNKICSAKEAELVKYGGNCFFYTKVIFMNILYDLGRKMNCSWDVLGEMLSADPRIGRVHMNPVHKGGRGGGGHCFIKDFAAFIEMHKNMIPKDKKGLAVLLANENKNIELLISTKKDLELLRGVYGKKIKNK